MKRQQISQIVKAFKFKKRDTDSYYLELDDYKLYLYYFKDKPKGWRLQICELENHTDVVRDVHDPVDVLNHIANFASQISIQEEKIRVKSKLSEVIRQT